MRILFASTGGAGHFSSTCAVRALLDDPRYRDRARRIAHEIRALPPVDRAVRALTALAGGQTQPT
jgi:UDP:flavonoid glycosyltransferase YjiC (YdhE family)